MYKANKGVVLVLELMRSYDRVVIISVHWLEPIHIIATIQFFFLCCLEGDLGILLDNSILKNIKERKLTIMQLLTHLKIFQRTDERA